MEEESRAAALLEDAVARLLDGVHRSLGLGDEDAARELVAETLGVLHQRALSGQLDPAPAKPMHHGMKLVPSKRQAFLHGLADLIDLFPDEGQAVS